MKVSLIGATGPVGQRIVAELLDRGHEVKAVVGDISKLTERTNLSAASADVGDVEGMVAALSGSDAVISSIRFLKTDPEKLIKRNPRIRCLTLSLGWRSGQPLRTGYHNQAYR